MFFQMLMYLSTNKEKRYAYDIETIEKEKLFKHLWTNCRLNI